MIRFRDMTTTMRRPAALLAALVCGLMMTLTGTALAWDGHDGHDKDKGCSFGQAVGDAQAGPTAGVPVFAPKFTLCKTGPADTDVTGYFAASVVPSGGLIAPQGPVTCAAFDGKTVSFLYPLNEKTSPPVPPNLTAILIVAKDGGPNGAGDTVGFFGPAPIVAFGGNNCSFSTLPSAVAGNITMLPLVSGDVTVEPPKA